jgi:hypothetical protein
MTATALGVVGAMLVLGALALGLMVYLGTIRVPLVLKGAVKMRDIAVDRGGWPEGEHRVANAVDNQFQLPVLFYAGCLLALWFGATLLELLLAWAFVVTRYVHAYIHVTHNHVLRRFWAFFIGLLILCGLWLDLAVRLVFSGYQLS